MFPPPSAYSEKNRSKVFKFPPSSIERVPKPSVVIRANCPEVIPLAVVPKLITPFLNPVTSIVPVPQSAVELLGKSRFVTVFLTVRFIFPVTIVILPPFD